jgi:hypothetical protein
MVYIDQSLVNAAESPPDAYAVYDIYGDRHLVFSALEWRILIHALYLKYALRHR